jgi:hypothetical protein
MKTSKTMSSKILESTILQRKEEIVQSKIDNEIVMMDIVNGEYYGLNTIASHIWELIEIPLSVKALIAHLRREYEVDENQCKKEVEKLLTEMIAHNLIILST